MGADIITILDGVPMYESPAGAQAQYAQLCQLPRGVIFQTDGATQGSAELPGRRLGPEECQALLRSLKSGTAKVGLDCVLERVRTDMAAAAAGAPTQTTIAANLQGGGTAVPRRKPVQLVKMTGSNGSPSKYGEGFGYPGVVRAVTTRINLSPFITTSLISSPWVSIKLFIDGNPLSAEDPFKATIVQAGFTVPVGSGKLKVSGGAKLSFTKDQPAQPQFMLSYELPLNIF